MKFTIYYEDHHGDDCAKTIEARDRDAALYEFILHLCESEPETLAGRMREVDDRYNWLFIRMDWRIRIVPEKGEPDPMDEAVEHLKAAKEIFDATGKGAFLSRDIHSFLKKRDDYQGKYPKAGAAAQRYVNIDQGD